MLIIFLNQHHEIEWNIVFGYVNSIKMVYELLVILIIDIIANIIINNINNIINNIDIIDCKLFRSVQTRIVN